MIEYINIIQYGISVISHVSIEDKNDKKKNPYWIPSRSAWSNCSTRCGNTTQTLRCVRSDGGSIIKCSHTRTCSEQCGGKYT